MEGCGVAVFKVSEKTLARIERRGIHYFENATQARGYSDYYHKYEPWQETPVPTDWSSEGSWIVCSVISKSLERKILESARMAGSYYTTKDEGALIVIPSLGYVVFYFNG